jgi:hypothetical protein
MIQETQDNKQDNTKAGQRLDSTAAYGDRAVIG